MCNKRIIVVLGAVLFSITGVCFSHPEKPYKVDSHTLFLCHFDKGATADYSKGNPIPLSGNGEIVEEGRFGKGLLLRPGARVVYKADDGNIELSQGTIEFYIRPNWDGTDPRFIPIFWTSSAKNNYININMLSKKQYHRKERFGGGICSSPLDNPNKYTYVRFGADVSNWKKGEWHHVAVTWGKDGLFFYIDGEKKGEWKNAKPPQGIARSFMLLGCDGVIDEFRISDIEREFSKSAGSSSKTKKEGFVYLSDIEPAEVYCGLTALGRDCRWTMAGKKQPLAIGGYYYKKGLGTHAPTWITYDIKGAYEKFSALLGVSSLAGGDGSVKFLVYGDGKKLYESKVFTRETKPERIEIPIRGIKKLKLVLSDAGDGHKYDHGNWVDAVLLKKGASPPPPSRGEKIPEKKIKMEFANAYKYDFSLPENEKGYWVVPKNYLDDLDPKIPPQNLKENTISTFATPGEYEPVTFVIYAEKELKDIEVSLSDLKSKNNVISRNNFKVRTVMRAPERIGYWMSSNPENYTITNRFLPEFEKFNLKEKEFREIWVTIKVPEKAKPGNYQGKIIISPKNRPSYRINLSLQVFPFRLKNNPKKRYGLYYYVLSNLDKDKERTLLELKDMKEHGISILALLCCPSVSIDYYLDKKNKIRADYHRIRRGLNILREAGCKNWTVIIGTGFGSLAALCGHHIKVNYSSKLAKEIEKDKKFFQLAKEAIEGFRKIQKEYPDFELLLSHMDEVFNRGRLPLYITLTKAAQQVPGVKMYITFNTRGEREEEMRKEIDPYVDVRCNHGYTFEWWLARGHTIEEYKKELKRSGDIAYFYHNLRGVWDTPEWQRIINGLYAWINPFSARVDWMYYHFYGQATNPFTIDARGGHLFGFAVPSPKDNKTPVPTRCWEGWREGIDDLKYLYTLEDLIEQYNVKGRQKEVQEAKDWLNEVRLMLPKPQGLRIGKPGTPGEAPFINAIAEKFTFEDYQHIRYKTASYIIKLKNNLK